MSSQAGRASFRSSALAKNAASCARWSERSRATRSWTASRPLHPSLWKRRSHMSNTVAHTRTPHSSALSGNAGSPLSISNRRTSVPLSPRTPKQPSRTRASAASTGALGSDRTLATWNASAEADNSANVFSSSSKSRTRSSRPFEMNRSCSSARSAGPAIPRAPWSRRRDASTVASRTFSVPSEFTIQESAVKALPPARASASRRSGRADTRRSARCASVRSASPTASSLGP
jgi:hypothetical protein